MAAAPKLFLLNTDRFLALWLAALTKDQTWKQFVEIVKRDNGEDGLSHTHASYFAGTDGRMKLEEFRQVYVEFHADNDIDMPSDTDKAVLDYFYNEKILDKMNNLRSKPNMKIRRLDDGWKTRPCVKRGGGAKKRNWKEVSKEFSKFLE